MSGPDNARLWSEEALTSASEWEVVTRMAAQALDANRASDNRTPQRRVLGTHS